MGNGKKIKAWIDFIVWYITHIIMIACTLLTLYSLARYITTGHIDNRHEATTLEKRVVVERKTI